MDPARQPSFDEIDEAYKRMAYIVATHGPVFAPLFFRLEKERELARQRDPVMLARAVLAQRRSSPDSRS